MKRLLTSLLCLGWCTGNAQLLHPPIQQPYTLSVALSRHQSDAFGFQANPAALHLLNKVQGGIYGAQPFLMPETRLGALSLAVPAGSTRFGIMLQQSGSNSLRQSGLGISIAQVLGKKGSLGSTFYYRSVSTAGYGTLSMLGVGLGGMLLLSEQLQAGFYIFRSASGHNKKEAERLAGYYSLQLGCDLSPQVYLSTALSQTESWTPDVQASINYRPVPNITTRLGIQTGTGELFLGTGFTYKKLQVHAFTNLHPHLGFSPGLQLLSGQNSKE